MNDYMLFSKERLSPRGGWGTNWDILISAYNSSPRVRLIAERVEAREKFWVLLPEYGYEARELPTSENIIKCDVANEAECVALLVERISPLADQKIVIDVSGFVNHYVLMLMASLAEAGVSACDVLYGEPLRYLQSERTRFSDEAVVEVRQIAGFEGVHTTNTNNDLLLLAVGYDYRLVAEVASDKEHAQKVQLFGLPSLRPDMYQENLLRAAKVSEAMGPDASEAIHFRYAPAYDPFVTASVISSIVNEHNEKYPHSNIYLSPLSTKAQALGFAVFYLKERLHTATSVIYPFCETYMRETSEGLSRVWKYHVELANILGTAKA